MKKQITKEEQKYINSLLDRRRTKELTKALTVNQSKDRLWMYNEENYIHKDGTKALDALIETYKRTR